MENKKENSTALGSDSAVQNSFTARQFWVSMDGLLGKELRIPNFLILDP